MALVVDMLYTTSTTWYTSSRCDDIDDCMMLFYIPAPVYVVVSARPIRVRGGILCPGILVYIEVSAYSSIHD